MPCLHEQTNPRLRPSIHGIVAMVALCLFVATLAPAWADKQAAGAITLSIGSAPAGTQLNDIIQIPIFLTSQSGTPADIILFIEYETGKLEFNSVAQLESALIL